jgi:hypothetical protein
LAAPNPTFVSATTDSHVSPTELLLEWQASSASPSA